MRAREAVLGVAGALLLGVGAALAQGGGARGSAADAPRAGQQSPPGPAPRGELKLVYERETFRYPAANRRDPFVPLGALDELGPRFEDLTLQGIIYSNVPDQSVVVISDRSGKRHRIRRGGVVGNARVLDILPTRVVFAVDNFGVVRQEVLELRGNRQGGSR